MVIWLEKKYLICLNFNCFQLLGVIVWEIMTLGEQPYRNIPMGCLYEKLKSGYRMEAPPTCPEEISSVMQRCWRDIPEERPSFKTIGNYFDKIIKGCDTYKEEVNIDL